MSADTSSRAGNPEDEGDETWEGYTFRPFVDQVAREHGAHVMDCLAEAVTNDPFNSGGTPGQQKLARWSRDIWVMLGSPRHSYIRGIHYRMGSLGTVRLPFGRFNGRKTGPPVHRLEDIERLEREHPEWKL